MSLFALLVTGQQKGIRMIAPIRSIAASTEVALSYSEKDPDTILAMLLHIDPNAAETMSPAYGFVKDQLRKSGWSNERLSLAIAQLVHNPKRIWVSYSGRSA